MTIAGMGIAAAVKNCTEIIKRTGAAKRLDKTIEKIFEAESFIPDIDDFGGYFIDAGKVRALLSPPRSLLFIFRGNKLDFKHEYVELGYPDWNMATISFFYFYDSEMILGLINDFAEGWEKDKRDVQKRIKKLTDHQMYQVIYEQKDPREI